MKSIYFEKDIPRVLITKALKKISPSLLYTGLSPVKYKKSLPDPPLPAGDWLKVKNVMAGVCGTDISFFQATTGTSIALEPMPASNITCLGHETVGVVTEIGLDVTRFKVGDRVTLQKYMPCCDLKRIKPRCYNCEEGNYCLCENYGEPNAIDLPLTGAGFGDYYLAPEDQLLPIPDELSDEDAVMVEPAAVSLHAVLMAPPKPGDKILVFGGGTIGLNVVQFLKVLCPECQVYLMERVAHKQAFAMKLGADGIVQGDPYQAAAKLTGGKVYEGMFKNKMLMGGYDMVYDCVGTKWAMENCLRWTKARGTLVKIGHHMCPTEFDETPIWWQEIKIVGINAHGMEHFEGRRISTFELVIEMLQQKKISLEGFVTHKYNVDDYKAAFKKMISDPAEVIKVVLEME